MPITTVLDLPKNESGLVDKFIGTAYDAVYAVYKDLATIDTIPSEVVKYGNLKDSMDADVLDNTALKSAIATSVNSNTNILNVINDLHNDTIAQNNSAVSVNNSSKDILGQVKQAQAEVNTNHDDTLTLKNTTNDLTNESRGYRDQLLSQVTDLQSKYTVIVNKADDAVDSAINADASAQAASTSAQAALGYKHLAENIVKTASEVAKIYPDTTQGIAGTYDGQYFNVSGSGDVYSYSYLNKGGNAVLQSTMPSYIYIQSLDSNKVNRGGDTITGDFNVTGNTSLNKLTVNSVSEITSPSKQLIVDNHADDDAYRQSVSTDGGKTFKMISLYNGDYNLFSDTGQCYINGQRIFAQNFMGVGSGLDAELLNGVEGSSYVRKDTPSVMSADVFLNGNSLINQDSYNDESARIQFNKNNHIELLNGNGDLASWFGLDNTDKSFNCNGSIHSQELYLPNISADTKSVNLTFGGNTLSLQEDGNATFLDSKQAPYININSSKVDLPSNTLINSNTIWHSGNMGSGSGLNADLVRGQDPAALCGSGDVQNGLNGWTRLPNNRIDMWFSAPAWIPGGSGENLYSFAFPRPITQTDIVFVSTMLSTGADGNDMFNMIRTECQYHMISWTNSSVTVLKQTTGLDNLPTKPIFNVKGIF